MGELHEQGELKKRIPSSPQARTGGLIEAPYDRMEADNDDSTDSGSSLQSRAKMHHACPSLEPAHGDIVWIKKQLHRVNDG